MHSVESAFEFDNGNNGRELTHFQTPFTEEIDPNLPPEKRAQLLVLAYLRRFGHDLGVEEKHIDHLQETLNDARPSENPGVQYRWGGLRPVLVRNGESIVWWLQQTHAFNQKIYGKRVFDVWEAGVRVVVHEKPLRIVGATSTAVMDIGRIGIEGTRSKQVKPYEVLARLLNLPPAFLQKEGDYDYALYRIATRDLRDAVSQTRDLFAKSQASQVELSQDRGWRADGTDIPVITAQFSLEDQYGERMTYRAFYDLDRFYYLKALTACVTGMVFEKDPRTFRGKSESTPDDNSDNLDVYRSKAPILRLFPPRKGRQYLEGELVEVRGEPGGQEGPSKPPGRNFHYASRTNQFAAVNAYYHCDQKFDLVRDFGFSLSALFPSNFPPPAGKSGVTVLSRAAIRPGCGDGRCVNAQVVQGAVPRSISEFRFALADLSDWNSPLGLAADDRFAWHEFCHALLVGATNNLEFSFAHSAGDAMAAIASDPASKLAHEGDWRWVTFPWVEGPLRSHKREADEGWGWYGQMYNPADYPSTSDPSGYRAEQILSTTLFRIYRSAGGDAEQGPKTADVKRRKAASNYVLYLIMRAIAALATSAVPTRTAISFANRLMEADIGTTLFTYEGANRPGGTLYKVIRWAFEKQGLYQPLGAEWPRNAKGDPPDRDVYIDDIQARHGEYDFTDRWQAAASALWLRNAPDGNPGHQEPAANKTSFVYIRVKNRGTHDAPATRVELYGNNGRKLDAWLNPIQPGSKWKKLNLHPGGVDQTDIPKDKSRVFGPFLWTPTGNQRVGVLAAASVTGDLANIHVPGLPCAAGPVALADLVPHDNNLGYREWKLP
jgi:hypothetical protein